MNDDRRFYEGVATGVIRVAPAASRNREPIIAVLHDWLPATGLVLEIASGTGEHAVAFAEACPRIDWQPSDVHGDALASIAARVAEANLRNLHAPLEIDAASADWPIGRADAILSINMVHISPWAATLGLLDGAARLLLAGQPLILYGPWLAADLATAPGNLAFDADLKRLDPAWGLRHVEKFAEEAGKRGLTLVERRAMPASNMMLLFRP